MNIFFIVKYGNKSELTICVSLPRPVIGFIVVLLLSFDPMAIEHFKDLWSVLFS